MSNQELQARVKELRELKRMQEELENSHYGGYIKAVLIGYLKNL